MKGFAFTLGLTTIVDLVVVMLFTHPMLGILAQYQVLRASGHPWSGLDPRQLGTGVVRQGERQGSRAQRLTLAERKAAARLGAPDVKEGQN